MASKKKEKENPLKQKLLSVITGKDYKPLTESELFEECAISPKLKKEASKVITKLLQEGLIEIKKKKISPPKKKNALIKGLLQIHPRGFGFVTPDKSFGMSQDIFIPKPFINQAIDQDIVEVEIMSQNFSDKGPEGTIKKILSRTRKIILGCIFAKENDTFLAYCNILQELKVVHVISSKKELKMGDHALLTIQDWSSYPRKLEAVAEDVLGNINDPKTDILRAVFDFGLKEKFPEDAIKEAKTYPTVPTKEDLQGRIDLTKEETFTIDPDTAKDFDDALSLKKDLKGHYHLIVHIADVSHYVKPGTHLDTEAYERSNSTYFPGKCLPMLPEELSNGLCSLKEDVIRLTVSVFMDIDPEGVLQRYTIKRSYIKSQKRFTYKEALKVIENKETSPHKPTLDLMVELCKLLQKQRNLRGSVDLSLPEMVLVLDENESPTHVEVIEYDITHQLVEEFMLKANEVVAHCLLDRGVDAIFRIHESPTDTDFGDFYALARVLGYPLKPNPTRQDIQKLFELAKNSPNQYQLSVAFIRSMKLAIYSEQNVGHYGLSLEHYTHFTSPIRRYSDLVVHRLLFEKKLSKNDLKEVASHCSDRERVSFRAESSVILQKKLRLLKKEIDEDPQKEFEALITKTKHYGFYFEVSPVMFEGFVHVSEIGDDYYIFQEKIEALVGRSTNQTFKSGMKIKVHLKELDLVTQECLWELCGCSRRKRR